MSDAGRDADVDDRYHRRSFTLDHEAHALLEQLAAETGKPFSQVVCLGLRSLIGDRRMLRHALVQPLNAVRLSCNVMAAQHPGDEDVHITIRDQFLRIEALLAPPKILSPAKW